MTVAVQVMADRRRAPLVSRLLDRLGVDDQHVTWDRRQQVWDTRRRATEAAAERGQDWTLVLQDDVLICRDFLSTVEQALATVPGGCVVHLAVLGSRSTGLAEEARHALARADVEGVPWVWSRVLLWGLAVAVPTVTVAEMLTWCARWSGTGDDVRIGQFYARRRWSVLYPRPSLVDHAPGPSLIQRGDPDNSTGRTAYRFIGEQTSGLGLQWAGPMVDLRC
jgi:hypothetical protein